jgi:hypothetical protein
MQVPAGDNFQVPPVEFEVWGLSTALDVFEEDLHFQKGATGF